MNGDVVPYRLSNLYGAATLLVSTYRGKYRDHPMMVAITPDVMAQLTDLALLRVFEKLNIFTDMTILSGWSDNDSIFAATSTIEQDEKNIQSIKYSVPAYVGNYKWMTTFFDEVTHETTHAVMQYYLGENLLTAPPWWREGLALHCAWPQGPTRGFIYYVIHNYNIDDMG